MITSIQHPLPCFSTTVWAIPAVTVGARYQLLEKPVAGLEPLDIAEVIHRHVEDVAHLGVPVVVVALEALLVAGGQLRDRKRIREIILNRQLDLGVLIFP